jgi:hypothetical protein
LIITLSNIELLFHRTKPIISFQWISGMSEHWGMTLQKIHHAYHAQVLLQLADFADCSPEPPSTVSVLPKAHE